MPFWGTKAKILRNRWMVCSWIYFESKNSEGRSSNPNKMAKFRRWPRILPSLLEFEYFTWDSTFFIIKKLRKNKGISRKLEQSTERLHFRGLQENW